MSTISPHDQLAILSSRFIARALVPFALMNVRGKQEEDLKSASGTNNAILQRTKTSVEVAEELTL